MQVQLNRTLDQNDLEVKILGLNAVNQGGTPGMVEGRTLPWLQDTEEEKVWDERWQPTWRDVVILDEQNRYVGSYSLTAYSLAIPGNYNWLFNRLKRLASRD